MVKLLRFLVGLLIVFVLVAGIGRLFFFEVVRIDSYSMVPNLLAGDYFLVYTRGDLDPGEVAVCRHPEDPETMVALRILGIPGSTFQMRHNHPILNGDMVQHQVDDPLAYVDNSSEEPMEYIVDMAQEYVGGHRYVVALMDRARDKSFRKIEVEYGFFLVGDNRNMSHDSRHFGEVEPEECIGTAFLVAWPGPDSGDFKRRERILEWVH